jgi:hypothetical protein
MMVTIELRDGIGGVGFRGRQDAPGAILQMGTIFILSAFSRHPHPVKKPAAVLIFGMLNCLTS